MSLVSRLLDPIRPRALPCQELVELVTDAFEGRLSSRDRRRFDAHLAGCEHCTAYVEQLRAAHARTGEVVLDDLTPAAEAQLRQAFRGWREQP